MKFIMKTIAVLSFCAMLGMVIGKQIGKEDYVPDSRSKMPRMLDEFAVGTMMENNEVVTAAPQCIGYDHHAVGWVYHKGYCYQFTSVHTAFERAEELCNKQGAYLADILTKEENDWIKSVLNVINPKDGTDYFVGGLDADRDKGIQWMTGAAMTFNDFIDGEPAGQPYIHMDFDQGFRWNTKNDHDDTDNGFICKYQVGRFP